MAKSIKECSKTLSDRLAAIGWGRYLPTQEQEQIARIAIKDWLADLARIAEEEKATRG